MVDIFKKINIDVPTDEAFYVFVHELAKWWPKEYTWSQETLRNISIAPYLNGPCTELGPFGFRCDWGRVTAYEERKRINFKWQISPQRVPEPNPDKASEVEVVFQSVDQQNTIVEFVHKNFKNHGEGAAGYQQAMDSEQGWDYILNKYVDYIRSK